MKAIVFSLVLLAASTVHAQNFTITDPYGNYTTGYVGPYGGWTYNNYYGYSYLFTSPPPPVYYAPTYPRSIHGTYPVYRSQRHRGW